MFDAHLRRLVEAPVRTLVTPLHNARVTANSLTTIGVVLAVPAALLIASHNYFLGALVLALASLMDLLDGPLARLAGTVTNRTSLMDPVSDRVTDVLAFGALAYSLRLHPILLVVALLALSSATLISYIRAKAESLGIDGKGGLMERAERQIGLITLLLVPHSLPVLLPILAILCILTATRRFQLSLIRFREQTQPEE